MESETNKPVQTLSDDDDKRSRIEFIADMFLNSGLGHKRVSEVLSEDMKALVQQIQDLLAFGKSRVADSSRGEEQSIYLAEIVSASSDLVSSLSDVVKFQSDATLELQKMAITFMSVTVKIQEHPDAPLDYPMLGETVVSNFEKDCNIIKTYNDLITCVFDAIEAFDAATNNLADDTVDKKEALKRLVTYKKQVIAENGIIDEMKGLIDIVKGTFAAIKDEVDVKVVENESKKDDNHSHSCECCDHDDKEEEEAKCKEGKEEGEKPQEGNYGIIQSMIEYAKEMIILSEVVSGLSNDMYDTCSIIISLSTALESDLKEAVKASSQEGEGESDDAKPKVSKNAIELFNCFTDLAQLFAGGAELEADNGSLQAELASQFADLLKIILVNLYKGAPADIVDIATHQSELAEEQSGIAVKVTSWIKGRSEVIAGLEKEHIDKMALVLQKVKELSTNLYDTALKQSNIAKGILSLVKRLDLNPVPVEEEDEDDEEEEEERMVDDDEVEDEKEEKAEVIMDESAIIRKKIAVMKKADRELDNVCMEQAKAAKVMAEIGTKIVAAAKKMMDFGKLLMMSAESQETSGLMLEIAFTESSLSSKQSAVTEKQSGLLGRQKVIIRLADDPDAIEEQVQVVRDQQALALEQMKVAQEQAEIAETVAQIADLVDKDEITAFSSDLLVLAKEIVDVAKKVAIIY